MLISYDKEIYEESTNSECTVKSSNMCQELGLISNIFSDKTGTLTRNEMKFVKFMINGKPYHIPGYESDRDTMSTRNPMNAAPSSSAGPVTLETQAEKDFITCLTICHTVVREKDGTYRAESPDELALVEGVHPYGCGLIERGTTNMKVELFGAPATYEILAVNAFDSDRKRQSILVRNSVTNEFFLYCKGADSVMVDLCRMDQTMKDTVDKDLFDLACFGLRTLCIAYKKIDRDTAMRWSQRWRDACSSLQNRAARVAEAGAEMELDLQLLGITAIEDRLQDEVPEVLADLANAGITLWMLTGDKEETAVNIGRSCNLLRNDTKLFFISGAISEDDFNLKLNIASNEINRSYIPGKGYKVMDQSPVEIALVMDGPSFKFFKEDDAGQREKLLKIGQCCRSVIACRLTPVQKQQLVKLVKDDTKPRAVTLAIGDGANDVSMIREADVGVGIIGKEGRQAANTADFAIGQFKFLKRLIMVHGRWNYIRQSKAFLYCMHKNMVITLTLFCFSFFTLVSGQTLYESWIYTSFNFALGLPIVIFGILDRDVTDKFATAHPAIYCTGRQNQMLSPFAICLWVVNALILAGIFVAFYFGFLYTSFQTYGIFEFGTSAFIALIIGLQMKVAFLHNQWNWINVFVMVISILGFYVWMLIVNAWLDQFPHYYYCARWTLEQYMTWLVSTITIPIIFGLVDLMGQGYYIFFDMPEELKFHWKSLESDGKLVRPVQQQTQSRGESSFA